MPPCNEISTAELGDTIITKGKEYTYDGIILMSRHQSGDGVFLQKITVEPGKLIAKEQDKMWTYFYADHGNIKVYDALIGEMYKQGGVKIHKRNKDVEELFFIIPPHYASYTPWEKLKYTHQRLTANDQPSFRQELIYNGRVGNYVKFIYRELSNDVMRPAFSQSIQYDLEQNKTLGFKGVRFKVIEATNTLIKYKVLKSFPDSF